MNGTEIRALRRRLGMTQNDVATALQVDQGTVSRWERGKEAPRPVNLAALRDLIQSDSERRAASRLRTFMSGEMYSTMFMNAHAQIREVSRLCEKHYNERFALDIADHFGKTFYRHVAAVGREQLDPALSDCNAFKGDTLLVRTWMNVRGVASCNVFEPVFEHGTFVGTVGYLASRHRIEPNDEVTLEKVEVIFAEAPDRVEVTVEGKRASMMTPGYLVQTPVEAPIWSSPAPPRHFLPRLVNLRNA